MRATRSFINSSQGERVCHQGLTTALFWNTVLLTSFLFPLDALPFIPSWHTQWRCCKNGFCNTSIFFRRVVSSKTTGHFLKNDKSLFENDRSFLHNRRVVFINTWGVWKSHRRKHKRIPRISFVKIPIFTLPHARTRTRTLTTGIFDFLLSQVSQNFHNILFFRILECGQDVF